MKKPQTKASFVGKMPKGRGEEANRNRVGPVNKQRICRAELKERDLIEKIMLPQERSVEVEMIREKRISGLSDGSLQVQIVRTRLRGMM
jgi:hypothetical protein